MSIPVSGDRDRTAQKRGSAKSKKGSNMSIKLKALSLGLLAILATSAFAVMNASAKNNGHFGSSVQHTTIKGTEGPDKAHRLHLVSHGSEGEIGCNEATYEGTATVSPVSSISVKPKYGGCTTTANGNAVEVTPGKCEYKFEVEKGGTNGTASLVCPEGRVEIHHPNCTITIGQEAANENLSGIHYTTIVEGPNNVHAITMHVNVQFTSQYHGGICIFLGTHHTGTLKGSVTVRGFDTAGNQVGITAT